MVASFISDRWQQDGGTRAICLGEDLHRGASSEREAGAHGCVGEQCVVVAQALVCIDVTPVTGQVPQHDAGDGQARLLQGGPDGGGNKQAAQYELRLRRVSGISFHGEMLCEWMRDSVLNMIGWMRRNWGNPDQRPGL